MKWLFGPTKFLGRSSNLLKYCKSNILFFNTFVPDLFKDYFNTRHCDIHSYNTRSRKNLYVDKINLEITKHGFSHKGATILATYFLSLYMFSFLFLFFI